MKVRGKRVINTDEAADFANSIRGQYIISQALVIGVERLKKYEDKDSPLNIVIPLSPDKDKYDLKSATIFFLLSFPVLCFLK